MGFEGVHLANIRVLVLSNLKNAYHDRAQSDLYKGNVREAKKWLREQITLSREIDGGEGETWRYAIKDYNYVLKMLGEEQVSEEDFRS